VGTYVDLGGVRTWYDELGQGEPLVALHPGLVDARALAATVEVLAGHFHVYTPERRGHGHTPDPGGPLSFEAMADDTVAFLEQVVGAPARLLGVSDGAMVAVLTAVRRPDLVERLACIAGPFNLHGWVPEAIDPANAPPDAFAASYGEVSPDGIGHYAAVVEKLARAHLEGPTLTAGDLAGIGRRALVMMADDEEVTLEHAVEFYRALPAGELAIVPGTSHGLLVEKPDLCHRIILDFLDNDPVPTLAPIRRRAAR
jgi:pimeloyl-ACP methyl ester carboxylesterase